ncbi:MAG: hypothetical protein P8K76_06900 [Candidatus Binatia bacterium]|nr:hypothetical protein [Candidatus Binatia bacterium]MDG2009490.1 hypothetical protein [Candidatus Binatia bacterium]
MTDSKNLALRVRNAISEASEVDFPFEELALEIFEFQFAHCEPYRKFAERRGQTPDAIEHWQDIPAVPTSAFKALDLTCSSPERIFLTSGTTAGKERRGRHLMPDLSLYRASALRQFRAMVLPDGAVPRIIGLMAGPETLPDSSLVQMVEWIREDLDGAPASYLVGDGPFDPASATAQLRSLALDSRPVCLIGVRAVFTALLDHLRIKKTQIEFAANSRIVDTGGPKGGRTLSDAGFLRASWEHLGIPGYYCINEYGMTELSSQYYDNVLERRFAGSNAKRRKAAPPWLRSVAVDPETLEVLPDGEAGLLRHLDLANALSLMAIQTEDLGVVDGEFLQLRGRLAGAEPRGCALALEHLLDSTKVASETSRN